MSNRKNPLQENESSLKWWDAHLLAQAAQRAVPGSATRRGLWNAFNKKDKTAEAMYQIEEEIQKSKAAKK